MATIGAGRESPLPRGIPGRLVVAEVTGPVRGPGRRLPMAGAGRGPSLADLLLPGGMDARGPAEGRHAEFPPSIRGGSPLMSRADEERRLRGESLYRCRRCPAGEAPLLIRIDLPHPRSADSAPARDVGRSLSTEGFLTPADGFAAHRGAFGLRAELGTEWDGVGRRRNRPLRGQAVKSTLRVNRPFSAARYPLCRTRLRSGPRRGAEPVLRGRSRKTMPPGRAGMSGGIGEDPPHRRASPEKAIAARPRKLAENQAVHV